MREEVTEDWRKMHTEELYELYSSLDVITVMRET
jgi:hypothetical protein